MGLEFAGAALLLALVGYYIDRQAGTQPWGAVIGLGIGLVGGMYRFIKEALAANRQFEQQRQQARDEEAAPRRDANQPPPTDRPTDDAPSGPSPSDRPDSDDDDRP